MKWIESLGGPLLLMEESLLAFWDGANAPHAGRIVHAQSRAAGADAATDYDRACDVRRMVGTIEVGPATAVVLGGEPLPTTWVPDTDGNGGVIVRWMYADNEETIARTLPLVSDATFGASRMRVAVEAPLVLFDAAMPGYQIATPFLNITLTAGDYEMETGWYQPDEATSLLLHRLRVVEV